MSLFKKAERKQSKLKLAIEGPSGSGKTYSALVVASGLVGEDGKIAVIDTEEGSASLYSHLFDFDVCELSNHSPEKYIEAIKEAEKVYDCIIIDSITPEWTFLLDAKSKIPGNSYTAWAKITPRHERFVQAITHAKCHVISTMRSKQAYVLEANDKGKQTPRKVGLQAQQRDGTEYEFTTVFSMDISHYGNSSKDRTGLFGVDNWFQPSKETGEQLKVWLESGEPPKENRDRELGVLRDYASKKLLNESEIKSISEFKEDENWPALDMLYFRVVDRVSNNSNPEQDPTEVEGVEKVPTSKDLIDMWGKLSPEQIQEVTNQTGIADPSTIANPKAVKNMVDKITEVCEHIA